MLETAKAAISPVSYSTKVQHQDCTEPGALEEKDDHDTNSSKDAKGAERGKNGRGSDPKGDKVCDGGDADRHPRSPHHPAHYILRPSFAFTSCLEGGETLTDDKHVV